MATERTLLTALAALLAAMVFATPASAFPGFYVGKSAAQRSAYATHVVIAKKGDRSVVTVATDYDGPLEPFAFVMPVPEDVTPDRVKILKRGAIDRLERLTAPRFHEFWETDPCDPDPVKQEWERDLKVTGAGMLGGGSTGGERKVPKEMLVTVTPEFMGEKEYGVEVLGEADSKNLRGWLTKHGWVPPEGMDQAMAPYLQAGMRVLVAAVDANRIELVGGSRAELLPIRFHTDKPYDSVPAAVGLLDLDKAQDLFVYVLADRRYEAKERPNVFPPTNIAVDFVVKERVGEFYNALTDLILAKQPRAALNEYAWPSDGCGEPCVDEPLGIGELMTFGGDVFEEAVPEEERHPKASELTGQEQKQEDAELEELKPADRAREKKQRAADRKELARRKALIARNRYVVSRLHLHYGKDSLGGDLRVGPASGAVMGGVWIPKGKNGEIDTEVVSTQVDRLQTRYINLHPWAGMMDCASPARYRWGKPPRTYRGLRKIWVAEDLSRKSRTQIVPAKVVLVPIPSLGLAAAAPASADAAPAGSTAPAPSSSAAADGAKTSSCGCATPGRGSRTGSVVGLGLALALGLGARRRRARR
ncbi:MAG: DUF2330 domain-containing protein [Polyangiaceae bacterium]|nr:DUF2330 domain-containing protein [Polyangiaceae bacterium]